MHRPFPIQVLLQHIHAPHDHFTSSLALPESPQQVVLALLGAAGSAAALPPCAPALSAAVGSGPHAALANHAAVTGPVVVTVDAAAVKSGAVALSVGVLAVVAMPDAVAKPVGWGVSGTGPGLVIRLEAASTSVVPATLVAEGLLVVMPHAAAMSPGLVVCLAGSLVLGGPLALAAAAGLA